MKQTALEKRKKTNEGLDTINETQAELTMAIRHRLNDSSEFKLSLVEMIRPAFDKARRICELTEGRKFK